MRRGFTLIELLVSIAIVAMITGTLYFSLSAALESWGYSRDQLALQKVISGVMDELIGGTVSTHGLRDALEVIDAGRERVDFVPPWTDDTHSIATKEFVYTLNRRIKPGASPPIAEIKLPESRELRLVPVSLIESEDPLSSQVRLGIALPKGSEVHFTYHPDSKAHPEVIESIWFDSNDKQVYVEDSNGMRKISKNPFGVEIVNMRLRYYDNLNNLITESDWVDGKYLNTITGIEVYIEASLGQYRQTQLSFVNLRNAPMKSGYLSLREDLEIPVPDSHKIHTLLLTNLSGVSNGDELQLEANPKSGKAWRVKAVFSRTGSAAPKLESYTIEYPPGNVVYTEFPRRPVDLGLDLLALGTNGLFDYDDDDDIEDFVILEDEVALKVTKMDIEGAGLFVKP